MLLSRLVADFVSQQLLNNNDEVYSWRVNERFLPLGIAIEGNNNLERNLSLKYALNEAWLNSENDLQRRGDLIEYYISVWGGIRSNGVNTMNIYRTANAETLIDRGLNGIASWSKALVVHDPNLYAIYDVRVVSALNYLQLLNHGVQQKANFTILNKGRNRIINKANALITRLGLCNNWFNIPINETYTEYYIPLLLDSSRLINTNISTIEMLLFNNAPLLAERVLAEYI